MTALGEAFEKAGLRPRDVAFDRSIAIYLNSGGTIEEARARVELAASRMPGMDLERRTREGQDGVVQTRQQAEDVRGQSPDASNGHSRSALPSSLIEDGGANERMPQGPHSAASPSSSSSVGADHAQGSPKGQIDPVSSSANPNPDGGGQIGHAQKSHAPVVPPVSEPSAAYLKAAGESRLQAARSILYRYTTSTGKFWGDVHPYEVGSMTRDHLRGMALMSALGPLSPKQMKMTFAQLMTPKKAEIAMQNADKELVNV